MRKGSQCPAARLHPRRGSKEEVCSEAAPAKPDTPEGRKGEYNIIFGREGGGRRLGTMGRFDRCGPPQRPACHPPRADSGDRLAAPRAQRPGQRSAIGRRAATRSRRAPCQARPQARRPGPCGPLGCRWPRSGPGSPQPAAADWSARGPSRQREARWRTTELRWHVYRC